MNTVPSITLTQPVVHPLGSQPFDYINLKHCFETSPPPRDDVLPGLPPGAVGGFVAAGGVGKSFLAMQLSCCLSAGKNDFMGLWRDKQFNAGQVLFLSAEDPLVEIHRRLFSIGVHWPAADRDFIFERLHLADRHGRRGNDLFDDAFAQAIVDQAADHRLIVIDTLRRFHKADENDGGAMAELVARLEWIAHESGAAVLFLHHVSKAAALAGDGGAQQASRGSSVLTDNSRFQLNLVSMEDSEAKKFGVADEQRRYFVRLTSSKLNYSTPLGNLWLRRGEGGVLVKAVLSEADGGRERRRMAKEGRNEL
ncbi:MAG: AAA family ATPase [Ferrovum sp.]|nr:AAA family ATPase [Ferrovum sp.]